MPKILKYDEFVNCTFLLRYVLELFTQIIDSLDTREIALAVLAQMPEVQVLEKERFTVWNRGCHCINSQECVLIIVFDSL